jgi:hypothetical protein
VYKSSSCLPHTSWPRTNGRRTSHRRKRCTHAPTSCPAAHPHLPPFCSADPSRRPAASACVPAVPASPVAPVTPRTAPAASRPAPQARVLQRGLRRLQWVRGWPLVQRAPHVLRQPASHGLGRQQLPVLHLPYHKISDSPGISP